MHRSHSCDRATSSMLVRAVAALAAALAVLPAEVSAQKAEATSIPAEVAVTARATLPLDSVVLTTDQVTVKGQRVPYTASTGTLPVYDQEGTPIAALFYVYYQRSDVQDRTTRPIFISFNGGPGSSSVWMHMGYTGPRRIMIDDEGNPVQPYGFRENPHTILDVADIVFVDPVNVGLSRAVEGHDASEFFGVQPDITYLARWIHTFITRYDRWASPKYLIGESYGTTRVSGLADELQNQQKIFLNGVILVSPTTLDIPRSGPVGEALTLPHYAATAWYHGQLDPDLQSRDLDEILPEVERFTVEEYIPALTRGGFLPAEERRAMARQVARWAGVSPEFIDDHNLAVDVGQWRKELMREEGLTVGRLDARYQGVDREDAGVTYDYDPAMSAWNHSFAPAMNLYLRNRLGWVTDLKYIIIGGPVRPWDRDPGAEGVAERLRAAMAENPYLHVMIQSGYFDGGTDYFSAKYSMWQMDRSGKLGDRLRWEGYRSGHMMYLRDEDLETSNEDIREFILASTPGPGAAAFWGHRVPANSGR